MLVFEKFRPVFAPEGGLAGAAAAGGGDGGDAGGGAGGGTGEGDTWSPPEGIPADYVGTTADETLAKLLPAYTDANTRMTGLRDKLAKMPAAPETADAYTLDPGEKLAPFFGDLKDNPAWNHARQAAHKHGMSQDQLQGFISDVYGPMFDQGLLPTPYDAAAEVKSFMTASGLDRTATTSALQANEAFATGLSKQLKDVPEAMKTEVEAQLVSLTDTASGNFLLQALSGRLSENGINVGGEGGNSGALTAEDVKALHSDPRIDPRNRNHSDPDKRYDEELRKRYDEACNRSG
ncbi:hypothetical protein [Roseibium album]|uniref:hypothetical protein n=1 Tax=Roseibium album TaxID=311410 RepID=UPI002490CF9D|nr:hypothetical protein [Roseibium album]